MYIYIYINFKAINNVLDAKMVLKTHLLIKIFRLLYRSFVSFMSSQSFSQLVALNLQYNGIKIT